MTENHEIVKYAKLGFHKTFENSSRENNSSRKQILANIGSRENKYFLKGVFSLHEVAKRQEHLFKF